LAHKVLEIHHLAEEGQVRVGLEDGDGYRTAPPADFQNPLSQAEFAEIAWYFRDFLVDPFGPSKDRAQTVETGLRNLGRLLFEAVFRANAEAEGLLDAARSQGLADFQLAVVSSKSEFLALPWELLNEPESGYLASQLASVVRRTGRDTVDQFASILTDEQLNVLLVSPMPFSEEIPADSPLINEVPVNPPLSMEGFGGLALEALNALESLEVEVELHCLRPPTFDALAHHLDQHSGHYHLVLLDGVGVANDGLALLLESEAGDADPVPAARIAELLVKAEIPVALLYGGTGGSGQVWAQAATTLVDGGIPLVVSVPGPLARVARDSLVQRFFQALVQGTDVPSAVAQGRKSLMDSPHRSTPDGPVLFWDWITPTVYQSREYIPQAIQREDPGPRSTGEPGRGGEPSPEHHLPQEGDYGLVGRRAELRNLERSFQRQPVVVLAGDAGVGKSELALALANWLQKTGARPGGVFHTAFEVGAGLERVIHETGTALAGLKFADMSPQEQRRWLVEYLRERQCLLILDSLENVSGFPRPAPGLLDEGEQAELDRFLTEVAQGGQSWILLVSRRKDEPWLQTPHRIFELAGLNVRDRMELAGVMLEKSGLLDTTGSRTSEMRLGPDFPPLLELLEGHPLALRLALPLLKEIPPPVLTGELRKQIGQQDPAGDDEGPPPFLTALMEYTFARMPRRDRVHLPFLSLFRRRVMMDILTHITQERVYRTAMGEELGWGACRTLLRSARDAGFLESVTPSVFQIHPTFPWFYGRMLYRQISAPAVRELEREFMRVYADTADYFMESLYENQDSGATAVLAEEGNLTQALALALEDGQWDSAQLLVQPLAQVYRMQKRYPELHRLRRQVMAAVDPTDGGAVEAEAKGAISLWLYLLGTESSEAIDTMDLGHAEKLNGQLLDYLTSLPDGDTDPRTATVYHELGVIALHRRQLEDAEGWFRRSLAIIEPAEDRDVSAVADDYYCLGQVRHHQRRYTEAKEWFSQSLEIHQRLQDEEEMVKDYRALGLAAQFKFEYDEAESWFNRAREVLEEHRDEETAALVYHELGSVCHARYQFDEAESWYQQALTLSDRLGLEERMAVEFHHLGLLAEARGLFLEDAEEWYRLALEKRQNMEDRTGAGDECRQLGVLFQAQERLDEAEQWYHQARELFEEAGDLNRITRTYGQLGMVAEARDDLVGALEWVARTYRLAVDHDLPALAQAKTHLARLRDKHGEDNFTGWWRGFTGGDPPTDLDVDANGQ